MWLSAMGRMDENKQQSNGNKKQEKYYPKIT